VLEALAAFQQGSSQLLFAEPRSLKFFSVDEGLKAGDELVACEHKGASATAAELVGTELGHEFVGLTPLNLEDLFNDGAIKDRGGKTLDLGDNVGQAVKPGELWRQDRTSAATDPEGVMWLVSCPLRVSAETVLAEIALRMLVPDRALGPGE
jgi:hypothetical protein